MSWQQMTWSPAEKKIARQAYDKALEAELASVLAEFKQKAFFVTTISEMWEIESYLRDQRRDIDAIFDYRYSQLASVFATLIYRGRLTLDDLAGLAEDKISLIRSIVER